METIDKKRIGEILDGMFPKGIAGRYARRACMKFYERIEDEIASSKANHEHDTKDCYSQQYIRNLISQERNNTTSYINAKVTHPQLLTMDVVVRFAKSNVFVVVYQRDGRLMVTTWRCLHDACFQTGKYDSEPWTHFTVIPRCTLEELTGEDTYGDREKKQ